MPGIRPRAGNVRATASNRSAARATTLTAWSAAAAAMLLTAAATACTALDTSAPAVTGSPVLGLPSPSPSAASAGRLGGTWVQDLAFSGDVSGRMTSITPNGPGQVSQCTGKNSRTGGNWASVITGPIGTQVYGLVFTVTGYRGPGSYSTNVVVQLHTPDNARVWQNTATDPVNVTVGSDEESGTVNARLTELTTTATSVTVTGRWSCRT